LKVRFIHQYFHPDLSSVSQVISQVGFHLAAQGDEVSVICSRNKYDGSQGDRLSAHEVIHGVEIRRCWGPSFGRRSLPGRILDMASFCVLATIRLAVAPKADTMVFLTNPPLFSLLGVVMKKIRNERFVYVLMDVYPDVAVRSGVLREGSAITCILRGIARAALKGADRVVVLGEDMRDVAVRSGAAQGKVVVIRNWADAEAIYPVPPEENRLRREWGLDGKFVVEYSGNLGVSHYFEDILAVAEDLVSFADIRFAFIGGGVRFHEVERFVVSKRLTNVILLPYQKESSLAMSLSAGDVHYVSLRPGFEGLVVPSKAYGIMAAGRPIVYQGAEGGEIARMVTREGIGHVIPPGDREGLRDCILSLYRNRKIRLRNGAAARQVLENNYSSAKGLSLYREVLAGER
jgi:glycosyltransferase involved in cell wall biosynthesis